VAPELSTPALRGLRVARILRLLRFNTHMRRFESMVLNVAPTVLNMSAIVFLFLTIFSLLGVELYAGVNVHTVAARSALAALVTRVLFTLPSTLVFTRLFTHLFTPSVHTFCSQGGWATPARTTTTSGPR